MSDMGLSIAASGLAADTALLDTASNNLANIDTPGYVAEQVNLSPEAAAGPLGAGQGVLIGSITQLQDAVYAVANTAAEGVAGSANQTSEILGSIESIFPEPSNSGIASQLTTLWSSLSTLAANPNEVGAEQAAAGAAQSVATSINAAYSQLSALAASLQGQIGSGANDGGTLAQANALLGQIAQNNVSIIAGDTAGQNVNELHDENTAAVNQLAGMLGVSTATAVNGSTTVYLNGVQLVSGDVAQTLTTTGSSSTANLAVATTNGVTLASQGSIGATLAAVNTTIPGYASQLDAVADGLATSMNTLQANGLSSSGEAGSAIGTGTVLPNIFVDGGSTGYTTSSVGFNSAATISVSAALLADPSLFATAAAPSGSNSNAIGTATLDGSNAQAMAALASSPSGADATYATLIGSLGTEAQNATTASTTASALATTASNNLSSFAGVNENTEEVDILAAQNAFQANSQVVSAITACFDSLLQAV